MNPETKRNSNSHPDAEIFIDAASQVKKGNRDGVKKLQVKNDSCSEDETVNEIEKQNSNMLSEKKNGIDNDKTIEKVVENQIDEMKVDGNDINCKRGDKCASPKPFGTISSNEINSLGKLNCNADVSVCNNDSVQEPGKNKTVSNADGDDINVNNDTNKVNHLKKDGMSETNDGIPDVQSKPATSLTASVECNTSMEVDSSENVESSKTEKTVGECSEKNNSTLPKDNVRPVEKIVAMSPEVIVADDGLVDRASSKDKLATESKVDKEKGTKDSTSSKVAVKDTGSAKQEFKGKEPDVNSQSEIKPESTKKEGESGKKKKSKTCEECGVKKGLKFQVVYQGKTRFLCSDTCFKNFKTKQKTGKPATDSSNNVTPVQPSMEKCAECQKEIQTGQGYYPLIGATKTLCSEECMKKYHEVNGPPKKCSQCKKVIEDVLHNTELLTWETMLFCNEDCLGKYQSFLGSHCTCCQAPVQQASLGKYCVCFGADIRQFCSGSCLEDFKKGLKVCSFCQTDLSAGTDGFLAPVGDKGQFKDFCSQRCMERYEVMNNISKTAPPVQECSHCKKQGTFKIQVKHDNKSYSLCCDLCVAGFRCSFKIKDNMCDTCYKFFSPNADEEFSLKFDGIHKHFCTKACMTLFVLSHRKIVPCVWCKVKKYNFDMIEKSDLNNHTQVFCSLNCLSLYRVSLNASSSKSIRCDNCAKNLPAQYHLTMSDGSIRNFCTYQCVIYFQNQFTNVPALTTTTTTRQTTTTAAASKTTSSTSTPVISNVISLAPAPRNVAPGVVNKLVPQKLVTVRQPSPSVALIAPKLQSQVPSSTITSPSATSTVTNAAGQQIIREVIVKPPAPKSVKNKTVSCKPVMQSKGVSCKPHPCHKAVQTDDSPRPIILPVPVPIYVPTPLHMFSRPVPCPVPFPVPVPIPIIIPTTKESPSQVIKHLKDIQEKIPSNPYEAEILMMAEMVAEDVGKNIRGESKTDGATSQLTKDDVTRVGNNASDSADQDTPPSLDAQEQNDAESEIEDEYVFKDSKSHHRHHHHHHGKRSTGSHGKSKNRKKCKIDDVPIPSVESRVSIKAGEDQQNATCQNDNTETIMGNLKVP